MLYQPITSCLWPGSGVRPDVNTAITCFLAPAGLIYALSFGFTFQQVLEKHRGVLAKVCWHVDDDKHIYVKSGIRSKISWTNRLRTWCVRLFKATWDIRSPVRNLYEVLVINCYYTKRWTKNKNFIFWNLKYNLNKKTQAFLKFGFCMFYCWHNRLFYDRGPYDRIVSNYIN